MRKLFCALLALSLVFSCALSVNAQMLISPAPRTLFIENTEDFLAFTENCRLDSYSQGLIVGLRSDLDLTGVDFQGIPIFCGIFYGGGYTVSGLNISSAGSRLGLFRILTETAQVQDLFVKGTVAPTGSQSLVGGIAGENAGTILSCSFQGSVSGLDYIGGITGRNTLTGTVEACSVSGSVSGTHFIGGIAGDNIGVIRDCQNSGDINTTVIQNSVQLEDITLESLTGSESAATATDIGGIAGTGTGVIHGCTNLGNVGYPLIGYNIGGIAGSYGGYIRDCVNTGAIEGRKDVGGIVGQLEPAVSMSFAEDTLQTLQGQMDTMATLTESTVSGAQAGASAMEGQLSDLQTHVQSAQDALNTLIPDPDAPQLPDEDTVQAAQNALSSSMAAISASLSAMGSTGEHVLGSTFQNLEALTGQIQAMGDTIGSASENFGGSLSDVSDLDTEADTTAKIQGCQNQAAVHGNMNIGGIAGNVSPETDLDPENDLLLFGEQSANFVCEFRAVIRDCENTAPVTGSKQYAGGIAGTMYLGLVKDCINYGSLTGTDYIGGICGYSGGYLRSSIARCLVSGETYLGGIVGYAATVTDCIALVQMTNQLEKFGSIAGYADTDSTVSGNFYLPVNGDLGGLDGISYIEKAQPLEADSFFALEGLPDGFRRMQITFRFEDGSTDILKVPYGSSLRADQIPDIPPQPGFEAQWTGSVSTADPLFFDTEFTVSRTAHIPTLESSTHCNGLPVLLVQGDFIQGEAVDAVESSGIWQLTLPVTQEPLVMRFLLPQGCQADRTVLQLQDGQGLWSEAAYRVEGSYLVFSAAPGTLALRLQIQPVNYIPYLLAIPVLLAVGLAVLLLCKRKKKK